MAQPGSPRISHSHLPTLQSSEVSVSAQAKDYPAGGGHRVYLLDFLVQASVYFFANMRNKGWPGYPRGLPSLGSGAPTLECKESCRSLLQVQESIMKSVSKQRLQRTWRKGEGGLVSLSARAIYFKEGQPWPGSSVDCSIQYTKRLQVWSPLGWYFSLTSMLGFFPLSLLYSLSKNQWKHIPRWG